MDKDELEPSIYRYILKHTKKEQALLLLLILVSMPLIYAALEVPKMIINSALSGVNIPDTLLGFEITQVQYLMVLSFTFLLLVLINGGLKYINNIYRGVLSEKMLRRFRFDLFSRLLRFPVPRFKTISQGEIIPMITAETEQLGGFIGDAIALPAFQLGLLVTYLFFIFNQDVLLGIAAVALYPIQLYVIPKLQKRINELGKARVQAVRTFSDKIGESISGISDIHVNDTSHYERAHASTSLDTIYNIRYEIYRKKYFVKFLNNFLAQITPFFFYAVGGYFIIQGELSIGALVAALAACKELSSPWKELLKFYQISEDLKVKYSQIINQFQPANMLNPGLQEDPERDIAITEMTVEGNALRYSEDTIINSLDGVSFFMQAGKATGIMGLGGSGRSVLTQLIARLIQPSSGNLKIAGQDINRLPEYVLSRAVAYVDQQSYVFRGTITDNLVYGLKNRPSYSKSLTPEQERQRVQFIEDATSTANSIDDPTAQWIDYRALGIADQHSFYDHLLRILDIVELKRDIYEIGLNSSIDFDQHPELSQAILSARRQLGQILALEENENLVDILNGERYQTNLSAAENLIFGVPKQRGTLEGLLQNKIVLQVTEQTGLRKTLFRVGLKTAGVMLDILSEIPEGSPMFDRFSFVQASDLVTLKSLANLPEDSTMDALSIEEVNQAVGLSFKLNVARHRLGVITPEIQDMIIRTHILLKEKLGENNHLIEFYHKDTIAGHLTIQENILFGRITYGQVNAQQKVADLTRIVIRDLALEEKIILIGLNYQVGVAGAKLTSMQRARLVLARALTKNPKLLIVNEATAIFDSKTEGSLIGRVLKHMELQTVIWVLGSAENMAVFDNLMVLEHGKIIAEGTPDELQNQQDLLEKLG